ncbi:HypC/HybG/HupF family hydrogenase formation chaperone [Selenomonas montiformis]|uniref:HypC/HybG/HupF family hydrogenase formation chaperone n=1 Tax=Selenomonas montiformis TaxID=2652285 RepID=A0A6I2UX37_9FIRM|nr:HypC/HybG/HupF family hydrogenase formation chaperone [Selenomonas montiformis]MDY4697063.1 HypC/HybG/HupF family hydrogenase formation chaperone [Selenomonas montiformis]MSV24680.1 HypC/HybG/HupF family hydrogenase formation chaperone [Selenomonas montiformis]
MCLAVPAKVLAIENAMGRVELSGVTREVSLMLLPETKVGDYVLVHAGFAMQKVDQKDAEETNALIAEMNGAPRTVGDLEESAANG